MELHMRITIGFLLKYMEFKKERLRYMDILIAVIPAAITGLVTLFGVVLTNGKNQAIVNERIDQLRKEVEKHNSVVERTYKLESDMCTAFKKVDDLNDRIVYLEHHKGGD